jgi:hypothetical protein
MDHIFLSVDKQMFEEMILYVVNYRKDMNGKDPLVVYFTSEMEDWISYNKFNEMYQYFTEYDLPEMIPINRRN